MPHTAVAIPVFTPSERKRELNETTYIILFGSSLGEN